LDADDVGRLAPRSVSTGGLIGQTLAIGPIFSAGFLSGTVAVFAGFNTPLSVLLAAVGTVALAYVLTLYGRRSAGPGAIYEYLARGTHSSVGLTHYGKAAHIPNVLEAVLILSATGSYLITLVYVMLAAGGLWLVRAEPARGRLWWRVPVVLTAVAVPILSFDGSLNPFPAYPNDVAVYFAGASVLIALAWYAVLTVWRPHTVRAAALHAEVVAIAPAAVAPAES
jgi:hypothetical protein